MALFQQATTLITYAVQPIPAVIIVKCFIAGVIQGAIMGLLVFFVYKSKAEEPKPVQMKKAESPLQAAA